MDDVSRFGMLSCASLVPVLAAFAVYCANEKPATAPVVTSASVVAPAAGESVRHRASDGTDVAVRVPPEGPRDAITADSDEEHSAPTPRDSYAKAKRKKSRRYIVTRDKRRIDCVVHPFQCRRYEEASALRAHEPDATTTSSLLNPGSLTQPTSSTPRGDPANVMTFTMDTSISE